MLTEIEWWGGLVILWAMSVITFLIKTSWPEKDLNYYAYHLMSVLAIALISLFFYPLESASLRLFYQGLLALTVAVIVFLIVRNGIIEYQERQQIAEQDNPDCYGDGADAYNEDEEPEDDEPDYDDESDFDDDESGTSLKHVLMGHLVLYTPAYIALFLGGLKGAFQVVVF